MVSIDRPKPPYFNWAFAALVTACGLSFIGFHPDYRFGIPIAIFSICVLLYGFWSRRRWGRTAAILISLCSLANLVFDVVLRRTMMRAGLDVVIAFLSVLLLYWLTRPSVKAYFEAPHGATPPTI